MQKKKKKKKKKKQQKNIHTTHTGGARGRDEKVMTGA